MWHIYLSSSSTCQWRQIPMDFLQQSCHWESFPRMVQTASVRHCGWQRRVNTPTQDKQCAYLKALSEDSPNYFIYFLNHKKSMFYIFQYKPQSYDQSKDLVIWFIHYNLISVHCNNMINIYLAILVTDGQL